jgi:hypothetical protein
MLDALTKARMALGLQEFACPSCKHAGQGMLPSDYTGCILFIARKREPNSCIPNTYNHFEAADGQD